MTVLIPKYVSCLMQRLEAAGYEAYLVGGCIRDSILCREINDYDLASSAPPQTTADIFADMTVIPTGMKHGTVTVLSQGHAVEITTYRIDGVYNDCRRPQSVTFASSIEEDLSRRDFTVNAVACALNGTIADPFNGIADMNEGIIRTVGEPRKRFEEDALRILRGLRFASVLGFSIEQDTAKAILECRALLKRVSAERIAKELDGLIRADGAGQVLERFAEVFYTFIPELDRGTKENAVMRKRVSISKNSLTARLSALLAYTPAENILRRLKYPASVIRDVSFAVSHTGILPVNEDETADMLVAYGTDGLTRIIELTKSDALARDDIIMTQRAERAAAYTEKILHSGRCLDLLSLNIKGGDIIALGADGKAVGTVLSMLLKEVSRGSIPNEKDVLTGKAGQILHNLY